MVTPVGLTVAVWVLITDRTPFPLDGLLDWCFHIFYQIAKLFTLIPYAKYHVASPSGLSILVLYAAIAMTLWWWREPVASPKAYVRTSAAGNTVVTLALWVWSPYAKPPDGEIRVSCLDVGQGDAILLQLPGPKVILVDGGAGSPRLDMGRAVIAPYLWDQGITHIDLMLATHPNWIIWADYPTFSVGSRWEKSGSMVRVEILNFIANLQPK